MGKQFQGPAVGDPRLEEVTQHAERQEVLGNMSMSIHSYIVLDRKVAAAIVHQNNHFSTKFIPDSVLKMQIPINDGTKLVSIEWLFNQWKERIDTVAKYIQEASRDEDGKRTL